MQTRKLIVLIAAVAAVPLMESVSFGQYRVDNRANTGANNRVGSNGQNEPINRGYPGQVGNNIVYNNITGGRGFRGNSSGDPRAFRGSTAGGGVDSFIAGSAGVTTGGRASFNTTNVQPYFGESRAVAPPAGFAQLPGSTGYIPARVTFNPVDIRLNVDRSNIPVLPGIGQAGVPGQLDPNVLTGGMADPLGQGFTNRLNQPVAVSEYTILNRPQQGGLDARSIFELRRQIQDLNAEPQAPNQPLDSSVGNPGTPTTPAGSSLNSNTTIPQESPFKPLAEAARQSTQIEQLQNKLKDFYADRFGVDPAEAANRNNEILRERAAPPKPEDANPANPNERVPGQPAQPGDPMNPDQPADPNDPNAQPADQPGAGIAPRRGTDNRPPAPTRITSFAEGVKVQGLATLMKDAEAMMREGKFASAIRQYEAAEQVAPNNGMVLVGRATAELGASFYRRADMTLREAYVLDRSLMLAQFDLRGMIPEDRLQVLVRELRELANRDPQQTTPLFLLAFIAYNTGNEVSAAGYLEQADARAKGEDQVIKLVREHWSLPDRPNK